MTESMQAPTKSILRIEDMWAGYDGEAVLKDIQFEMFAGDYVGIIGPNGGGKTTLIKVILGLLPVMRGSVSVLGQSPVQARDRLGYVPQVSRTDRDFPISVWDVVRMGREKAGFFGVRPLSAQDKQAIERALGQADVLDLAKRSFNELSGGQRQRVLIARALATNPEILVLDEPTANVDGQSTARLYDLLAELNQSLSILLVSHDLMAISTHVKTIACVNRKMVYHNEKVLTQEMMDLGYECPVELLAHGVPHRVLAHHDHDHLSSNTSHKQEDNQDV